MAGQLPTPPREVLANAVTADVGTHPGVNIPGANHLDRQRRLTPRHYIPLGYGRDPAATCAVPHGGDPVSAAVARVQHTLLLSYRAVRQHGSNRRTARAFGISDTVWQQAMSGQRWMGETVTAALLHAVLDW